MRVGSITAHNSIFLASKLGRMVGRNEPIDLFLFHLHVFLLLLGCHDEPAIGYKLVLTLRLVQASVVTLASLHGALLFNNILVR